MRRITVVIADEQPLFRRGMRWSLEQSQEVLVVGEAADGPAALALIERHRPTVAILPISLRATGVEVARAALERQPGLRVVLLAARDDDDQQARADRAGATALATKGIDGDDLMALVRDVAAGASPLADSRHARRGGGTGNGATAAPPRIGASGGTGPLSAREIGVLDLIARGESNREIATSLAVSEQTVKNAVSSILRKLGVGDRTQAVIAGLRAGWIALDGVEESRSRGVEEFEGEASVPPSS